MLLFDVYSPPARVAPAALVNALVRPFADVQSFDWNRASSSGALRIRADVRYERTSSFQLSQSWGFMRVSQSDDTLGPDGRPLGPPASPGSERRLNADQTGVVTHCDLVGQTFEERGFKVVRKLVSQNSKYGVVWRADLTAPGDDRAVSRLICWKIPGGGGYSLIDRPLEMFDPPASISPLSP